MWQKFDRFHTFLYVLEYDKENRNEKQNGESAEQHASDYARA